MSDMIDDGKALIGSFQHVGYFCSMDVAERRTKWKTEWGTREGTEDSCIIMDQACRNAVAVNVASCRINKSCYLFLSKMPCKFLKASATKHQVFFSCTNYDEHIVSLNCV